MTNHPITRRALAIAFFLLPIACGDPKGAAGAVDMFKPARVEQKAPNVESAPVRQLDPTADKKSGDELKQRARPVAKIE